MSEKQPRQGMRRFVVIRTEDESGVSGTGKVAEGVMFSDGVCAMRWVTKHTSTAIYNTIGELEAIHGHEGRTTVRWVDSCPHGVITRAIPPICHACGETLDA